MLCYAILKLVLLSWVMGSLQKREGYIFKYILNNFKTMVGYLLFNNWLWVLCHVVERHFHHRRRLPAIPVFWNVWEDSRERRNPHINRKCWDNDDDTSRASRRQPIHSQPQLQGRLRKAVPADTAEGLPEPRAERNAPGQAGPEERHQGGVATGGASGRPFFVSRLYCNNLSNNVWHCHSGAAF